MQGEGEWVPVVPQAIEGASITSRANQRVKAVRSLIGDRRKREASGCTVVQGLQPVRQAYEARLPIGHLVISDELRAQPSTIAWLRRFALEQPHSTVLVNGDVFRSLFPNSRPSGVAATVHVDVQPLATVKPPAGPCRVLVLNEIFNAGNLGSIVRTANACAYDTVVLVGDTVDPRDPSAARASMGALFSTALARCESLEELLGWCELHEVIPVATSVTAGGSPWTGPYPARRAIVFGSEGAGLPAQFLSTCGTSVSLPMHGTVESLNLAASVAAVLYVALAHEHVQMRTTVGEAQAAVEMGR